MVSQPYILKQDLVLHHPFHWISSRQQNHPCIDPIVGGGIRTPEQMKAAADAGADYIVTGTITEEFDDLQVLKERLQSLISVL